MLHALITAAAEHAGEESSKTLFYVAGGLLAGWAVLVAFVGMRGHENWPPNATAARGVMGISAALVVFTMFAAVITG